MGVLYNVCFVEAEPKVWLCTGFIVVVLDHRYVTFYLTFKHCFEGKTLEFKD